MYTNSKGVSMKSLCTRGGAWEGVRAGSLAQVVIPELE